MAEAAAEKIPTLAEQWSLPEEKSAENDTAVVSTKDENPQDTTTEVAVVENVEETPATEKPDEAPATEKPDEAPATEKADDVPSEEKPDENTVVEETSETPEEERSEEPETAEEQPTIKIETAPADFRFPTTNQTRHCFTRYIEYHRCIQAKGEDAQECNKFAKYYRSLCPSEWVERWNEQRENGTFPGPL